MINRLKVKIMKAKAHDLFLVIGLAIIVAGCAITTSAQTKNFLCDGDLALRADFSNSWRNVRTRFGTQDIRLKLVKSEEGSKYVLGKTIFWVNGNNARIASKSLDAACKAVEITNLAATVTSNYLCDGNVNLSAEFYEIGGPKRVRIRYGTQDFTLPIVRSGSGSKYSENKTTFWVKRNEATLESKVLNAACKVVE